MPSNDSRFSKISRRNRGRNDLSSNQSKAVNACFGTRRNRLGESHSLKMHRSAIIDRERRWESAADQSQQRWPPLLLAIVMWAARPTHESEAIIESTIGLAKRICQTVLDQQIAPALIPAITTPAFQAARNTLSSPCKRHTANRFALLPPPT
jgi:hypothetical protein